MDRIITVQRLVFVRSRSELKPRPKLLPRIITVSLGPGRHLDKSKALDNCSNNTYTVVCRTKPAHAAAVSWCEALVREIAGPFSSTLACVVDFLETKLTFHIFCSSYIVFDTGLRVSIIPGRPFREQE
jgi:hypothetical protein